MNQTVADLLLIHLPNILAGAWTGYITNDIAIRMIFKEYGVGKLKFGGVIPKTRHAFADSIAKLVEEELINRDAIEACVASDEFRTALETYLIDVCDEVVNRVSQYEKIADIPDVAPLLQQAAGAVVNSLLEPDGVIDRLLSRTEHLVRNGIDRRDSPLNTAIDGFSEAVAGSPELSAAFRDFYEQIGTLRLKNVFGDEFVQKTRRQIDVIFKQTNNIIKYDLPARVCLFTRQAAYLILDVRVLNRLCDGLHRLSAETLIGGTRLRALEGYLTEKTAALNGETLLSSIRVTLSRSEALRQRTITDVLTIDADGAQRVFAEFVDQAGTVTDIFLERWGDRLGELFEESIKRAIDAAEPGKSKAVTTARRRLSKDLVQKYQVVEKVREMVLAVETDYKGAQGRRHAMNGMERFLAGFTLSDIVENGLKLVGKGQAEKIYPGMIQALFRFLAAAKPFQLLETLSEDKKADLCVYFQGILEEALNFAVLEGDLLSGTLRDVAVGKFEEMADKEVAVFLPENNPVGGIRHIGTLLRAMMRSPFVQEISLADRVKATLDRKRATLAGTLADTAGRIRASRLTVFLEEKIRSVRKLPVFEKLSEACSAFAKSNADGFIRGNVRTAIKKKLDSFTDGELLDFAEALLGQFRHINIIGAVMGAILGVFSGVFTGGSNGLDILKNVVLFAMLGWITNVVALELLFRPHRPVKILQFKLESVINMNRGKFASAVSRFIDQSVMPPEISASILETHRATIANGVQQAAEQQYLRLLGQQDSGLRERIADAVCGFGGDKLQVHASSLSRDLTKKLTAIVTEPKVGDSFWQFLLGDDAQEAISKLLISLAQSDIPLVSLIPGGVPHVLRNLEGEIEKRLADLDAIELRSLLRKGISHGVEHKIQDWSHAGDGIAVSRQATDRLIRRMLQSGVLRDLAEQKAQEYRVKSDKAARKGEPDALVDAVGRVLLSNKDGVVRWLRDMLIGLVRQNERQTKAQFKQGIHANMNILSSMAYRFADGDELLEDAVSDFIRVQIPQFIQENEGVIDGVLGYLLEKLVSGFEQHNPVSVRYEQFGGLFGEIAADDAVAQVLSHELSGSLEELLKSLKRADLVFLLGLDDPRTVLTDLDVLIRPLSEALTENIRIEGRDLAREAASFVQEFVEKMAEQLSVADIFGEVREGDVRLLSEVVTQTFFSEQMRQMCWSAATQSLLVNQQEELEKALADFMAQWLTEEGETVRRCVKTCLDAILPAPSCAGLGTADGGTAAVSGLMNQIIEAGIDTLKRDAPQLLQIIDLKSVAENEINGMNTRKIEEVFHSFAGRYFRRIKLYGLWGGLFGIHYSLPSLTFIAALFLKIRNKFSKKPVDK